MSRSVARKRVHYVRALFKDDQRPSLEAMVRAALNGFALMAQTEVDHPSLGKMAIRERDVTTHDYIRLAIGAGVPREGMATLGLDVRAANDENLPEQPPTDRAYKLADAFCLIDDNDVLICTDGGMRVAAAGLYLQRLLAQGGQLNPDEPFELRSRLNQDAHRTLEIEGVKEIQISSTANAVATSEESDQSDGWLRRLWPTVIDRIREAFEEEARDDADRDQIARHWSELNITATIGMKGGSRADVAVSRSMQEIATSAREDAPEGAEIVLLTLKGNPVRGDSLGLGKSFDIKRLEAQNDLDWFHAWEKLAEYREELRQSGRWKT